MSADVRQFLKHEAFVDNAFASNLNPRNAP